MREETLKSVPEIIEFTKDLDSLKYWCYRGQSFYDWELIPSVYRPLLLYFQDSKVDEYSLIAQVERDTYREFFSEAAKLTSGLHTLEKIAIAQHHHVPTRLLDWSVSPLVGAYFAISGSVSDSALWALNLSDFPFPVELGRQHNGKGFRLENLTAYDDDHSPSFTQPVSRPSIPGLNIPDSTFLVWKPNRVDKRLDRQKGLHSWYHSYSSDDLIWDYSSHIRDLEKKAGVDLLIKIRIPNDHRKTIRNELSRMHFNDKEMFDDLDGLGRHLSISHSDKLIELAEEYFG